MYYNRVTMNIIPPFNVKMELHDLLYLSYLVPEERLRPYVPRQIAFAFTGEGRTVLSFVIFHCRNVGISFLPIARFAYDQVNIRTYVIDPLTGTPAVLFLKSGITSRFVSMATNILGIPWHFVSLAIVAGYDGNGLTRYNAEGRWERDFRVNLEAGAEPVVKGPFVSSHEAARSLMGPQTGFFIIPSGLARIEVKHPEAEPFFARISHMEFPLSLRLGLLSEDDLTTPFNAIVVAKAHFVVSMPPIILHPGD
ncbi:MAG TPA: DUF2071 domain-containing protein [Syntrophorhabdaceae bacterium]